MSRVRKPHLLTSSEPTRSLLPRRPRGALGHLADNRRVITETGCTLE